MILLITPAAKALDCAEALHQATSEEVHTAASLRQAATQLRTEEYSVVLVDQSIVDAEPDESDVVLQHTGTAMPIFVNLAICGIPRVLRELRLAQQRRKRETQADKRLRSPCATKCAVP